MILRSCSIPRVRWFLASVSKHFRHVQGTQQLEFQRSPLRMISCFLRIETVGFVTAPTDHRRVAISSLHTSEPPFTKILVANRGEIARRIIRTCRSMNIPSVAIYSTVDSKSPHVLEADEAICIGGPSPQESYLNVENIMEAISVSGADAVHPGYGFLSENAEFARRLSMSTKSVTFIGPSTGAIVAMGDKITSKRIAKDAGVNIIPGYDGIVNSPEEAVKISRAVGYPIMIKATSGGGGKGMRICRTDDEVKEGFVLSEAEARKFFNDGRLLIEKFIERPHHIEIQVLAGRKRLSSDGDNNEKGELEILCFPERECSIQRRNQKILEESPSTLLSIETRSEMVRQVKRLVRAVEYESTGTVEFLVDEEQNFYFLEVNTRLQVEHPVTEMLVSGYGDGVDLVYAMIEIAAGRGIPSKYLDLLESCEDIKDEEIEGMVVPASGHAIEARIYAEDPLRGFLPSTGPLLKYVEPPITASHCDDHAETLSKLIRVDSGVVAGSIISPHYDPMISKLIAYSSDRATAIRALREALDRYVINGVQHNVSFLTAVLRHPQFLAGNTPTNFIEQHFKPGSGVVLTGRERAELVAITATISRLRRDYLRLPPLTLMGEGQEVVVCLGGMFGDSYTVRNANPSGKFEVIERNEANTTTVENIFIESLEYHPCDPVVTIEMGNETKTVQIKEENNDGVFEVKFNGSDMSILVMSPEEYELSRYMKLPKVTDSSNLILSPMPGTLISYAVEDGENVVTGQEICIMEAMKMQNVIRSTRSGTIRRIATEGSSLMANETIVEFITYEEDNVT